MLAALTGCSPRFDWRVVRHPEGLWVATLPDKPVVVTRTVQLLIQGHPQPIDMELRSVRVGEQTFTMGVARNADSQLGREAIRLALEEAMVHNIQGKVLERGNRLLVSLQGPVQVSLLRATGSIRLSAQAPTEPAVLMMQSLVLGPVVIEAVVAGPQQGFSQEAADQFMESVSLQDGS